ncbi:MAG: hypothetical protein ACFFB3_17105 [Candidatus Hodarchaeota archaeon]
MRELPLPHGPFFRQTGQTEDSYYFLFFPQQQLMISFIRRFIERKAKQVMKAYVESLFDVEIWH